MDLDALNEFEDVAKNIINPVNVIEKTSYELKKPDLDRVLHGMSIINPGFENSDIVILVYSGKIYAIGVVEQDKILVKKVFEVL